MDYWDYLAGSGEIIIDLWGNVIHTIRIRPEPFGVAASIAQEAINDNMLTVTDDLFHEAGLALAAAEDAFLSIAFGGTTSAQVGASSGLIGEATRLLGLSSEGR